MKLSNFPVSTDTILKRVQLFQDVFVFFLLHPQPSKEFFLLSPEYIPFLSRCILNLDVSHRQCGINNPMRQTAFN